ncbi:MAG: aminomethyl transferase family protein [Myxococcaceae bacterium]|nr:aminomethyl transferase family protein [Myxococcaceae bacterium]MCI0673379.1 aminomethyl transferase family protein [Myxococcaceae bacterium]
MEPLPLHSLHARLEAAFGELNGREVVRSVGGLEEGYQAARSGVVLHDASSRDVLRLTGPDRVTYLHGMVTNDINGLPVGAACDAALLTAKGAMVADARVLKREEDLLVDLEPGLGPKVLEFLQRFLISEDAELTDVSSEWGQLGVYGPGAFAALSAALGSPQEVLARNAVRSVDFGGATVLLVGNPVPAGAGVDVLVPRAALEPLYGALLEKGRARPIGFDVLEVLRVEAGWPRYGQDMVDTTIPLEAHLERAISYNKGCYIGQEVIARATFRGHMNRKLAGLLLGEGEAPAPGAELRSGEKKAGWLTSVVRSPTLGQNVALGYVHRDLLTPGTELTLAGSGARATVAALPLVPPPGA